MKNSSSQINVRIMRISYATGNKLDAKGLK